MPLAQDLLGEDAANELDLKKLSQALLMQKLGGPQHSTVVDFGEDAKQGRAEAQRDALYERLLNTSFQPDKKSAMAMGIVKALSNLSYLGGIEAGEAGTSKAKELSDELYSGARQQAKDQSGLGVQLLKSADRRLAKYKPAGAGPDDTLKTLGTLNQMRGLNAGEQRQKDLQDYRAKKLKQDMVTKDKKDYPGAALTKQTRDEDAIWKQIVSAINTEKVRSAAGEVRRRKIQSQFVKGVFDQVPPPGVNSDAWRIKIAQNPQVLETEPRDGRIQRFHQMQPMQKAEAIFGWVRQVTGAEPTEETTRQVLSKSFGEKAARMMQYLHSWQNDKNIGAGDGALMEDFYQGVLREEHIADQELAKISGVAIRHYKPWLEADQSRVQMLRDMLTNPEEFIQQYQGQPVGSKDPSKMTDEELEAEAKRLRVQ